MSSRFLDLRSHFRDDDVVELYMFVTSFNMFDRDDVAMLEYYGERKTWVGWNEELGEMIARKCAWIDPFDICRDWKGRSWSPIRLEDFAEVGVDALLEVAGKAPPSWLCAARWYVELGLSVLPVDSRSKRPLVKSWSESMVRLPSRAEVDDLFQPRCGVAVVCGEVSGHLEVLDFDNKSDSDIGVFEDWAEVVFDAWGDKFRQLLVVATPNRGCPGEGYQVWYRVAGEVGRSRSLARVEIEGKTQTLVETRGEGGYAVTSPTLGYDVLQGSFDALPVLSVADRDYLVVVSEGFYADLEPSVKLPEVPVRIGAVDEQRLKAGDRYNGRDLFKDVLKRHGWRLVRRKGLEERWRRPGTDSDCSATFFTDSRLFYVHSTNAGVFDAGRDYFPFAVFSLLDHDGNYKSAARSLYCDFPEWNLSVTG